MSETPGEDWLYHLPAFLEKVQDQGAQRIVENIGGNVEGVLYHHRGARVPAHNATFLWGDGTFEVELDAVGSRSGWAVFDADRSWDFFLSQAPGDTPCLIWMSDAEFAADEADQFDEKAPAVGSGRFSFGLYLQPPPAWERLETQATETPAACFIHRPSGRTLIPEEGLDHYEEIVPPELLDSPESPPAHLGLVDAHVARD